MAKKRVKMLGSFIILAVSALIIGLLYLFLSQKQNENKSNPENALFLNWDSSAIVKIVIHQTIGGMTNKAQIEKVTNSWTYREPVYYPADEEGVERFINNFIGLSSASVITNANLDQLRDFGLINPQSIIELDTRDNKTLRLLVGKIAMSAKYYYTMMDDGARNVYLIEQDKLSDMVMNPIDLLIKNIFSISGDRITYLKARIAGAGIEVVQDKSGTNWTISSQAIHGKKWTNSDVKEKMIRLNTIVIDRYIDFKVSPAQSQYYFGKGIDSIEIRGGGETNLLRISSIAMNGFYPAALNGRPGIFLISAEAITNAILSNFSEWLPVKAGK